MEALCGQLRHRDHDAPLVRQRRARHHVHGHQLPNEYRDERAPARKGRPVRGGGHRRGRPLHKRALRPAGRRPLCSRLNQQLHRYRRRNESDLHPDRGRRRLQDPARGNGQECCRIGDGVLRGHGHRQVAGVSDAWGQIRTTMLQRGAPPCTSPVEIRRCWPSSAASTGWRSGRPRHSHPRRRRCAPSCACQASRWRYPRTS